MNPARSLAPALVSGKLQYLWIYLLAPQLAQASASWVAVVCANQVAVPQSDGAVGLSEKYQTKIRNSETALESPAFPNKIEWDWFRRARLRAFPGSGPGAT
jgi:Major intrinsic protein